MRATILCCVLFLIGAEILGAKEDLSLTTEGTNGNRVVVFRAAGDMTSTNAVKGTELDAGEDPAAKKLKTKLKIKEDK